MKTTVIIQNLKCNDCKDTVVTALDKFKGISNIYIDIGCSSLSFNYNSHNAIEGVRFYLSKIGHPITDDPGLNGNRDSEQDLALAE